MTKLPGQRAITANIARGAATLVEHEFAGGSEYIFDLLSDDAYAGLTDKQRAEYDRRVKRGLDVVVKRILRQA